MAFVFLACNSLGQQSLGLLRYHGILADTGTTRMISAPHFLSRPLRLLCSLGLPAISSRFSTSCSNESLPIESRHQPGRRRTQSSTHMNPGAHQHGRRRSPFCMELVRPWPCSRNPRYSKFLRDYIGFPASSPFPPHFSCQPTASRCPSCCPVLRPLFVGIQSQRALFSCLSLPPGPSSSVVNQAS